MNDIKLRQLCFIFAAMLPVTRMIVYPATLAYHAGSDLLLSAALSLALEGLVVGLMLWLARRTRHTFFGLLAENFGDAAARIVYGLFALFFDLSALLPLLEQRGFVMQVLYENVPPLICYAPFFGVCFFACTKGLRAVGRVADLSLPVFALSYAVVILLALPQADFGALLPVVESGARVWRGFAAGPCWYTACLYPLFFLGHVRYERRAAAKVLGAYAAGAAVTLLFLAVFYAVFSDISILQHNSLAQISKYATAFSSLGRADLLFIFALTLVLAFALCIPVQLSVHCAARALGCRPLLPAAVINAALLALTVFFNTSFREVQQFCTQRLWFVYAAFAYLVPVLALFLKRERPPQSGGSASHLLKGERPPQGGGNSYLLKSERPAQGAGRRAPLLSIFKRKEAHKSQRGRRHGRRVLHLSIFKKKEAHEPRRGSGHGRRAPFLSIFKKKEAHAPQRGRGRTEKRARGRGRRHG